MEAKNIQRGKICLFFRSIPKELSMNVFQISSCLFSFTISSLPYNIYIWPILEFKKYWLYSFFIPMTNHSNVIMANEE